MDMSAIQLLKLLVYVYPILNSTYVYNINFGGSAIRISYPYSAYWLLFLLYTTRIIIFYVRSTFILYEYCLGVVTIIKKNYSITTKFCPDGKSHSWNWGLGNDGMEEVARFICIM